MPTSLKLQEFLAAIENKNSSEAVKITKSWSISEDEINSLNSLDDSILHKLLRVRDSNNIIKFLIESGVKYDIISRAHDNTSPLLFAIKIISLQITLFTF